MRTSVLFGRVSLSLGCASIVFALVAQHLELLLPYRRGYLLSWLDAIGLVRAPRADGLAVWQAPGTFLLSDDIAVCWLFTNAFWLAICSTLFALWAERKQEDTLYLSAGFLCGILALMLLHYPSSILAMVAGASVVMLLRHHRGA